METSYAETLGVLNLGRRCACLSRRLRRRKHRNARRQEHVLRGLPAYGARQSSSRSGREERRGFLQRENGRRYL